jgi:hypothetical protein
MSAYLNIEENNNTDIDSKLSDSFEFRGISLLLLIKIGELAMKIDSINSWTMARISNVLLGSHESINVDGNSDVIMNIDINDY